MTELTRYDRLRRLARENFPQESARLLDEALEYLSLIHI